MIPSTVVGVVTGTGAAINVVVGFLPGYVKVINRATGASLEWFRNSTTSTRQTVTAGTNSVLTTTASIATFEGPTGEGFTIPINAAVNINTNALDYIALRTGPGAQ